ncbi:hypothetical protein ISF6_0264 [Piscinibacter sakaiensis]|uniref:Exostosin GT47 domain-containing protein n=2 Tax=Piscinibacter sakaiensis TaxID=1547922 RepID=A0A0K8P8I8_PISS1|nr:hypothetical protein ISF6_0264 [Piscinibacter sakaiensis]
MFWQFPCRTEAAAAQRHAGLDRPGELYLPLPWATWIDKQQLDLAALARVEAVLAERRRAAPGGLRVHTVCQHIFWARMLPVWRDLGVTDAWVSHRFAGGTRRASEEAQAAGVVLHPWSLFAVNVEDPARRAGLAPGLPASEREWLASFVGRYAEGYVSDHRLQLQALAGEPGCHIDVNTERWHFEDVVYGHQVRGEALADTYRIDERVERYNRLLCRSRFALCPTGSGPNTLRFWEALAVGSVPVLLGPAPELPSGGSLPAIDWEAIVLREEGDDMQGMLERLRQIGADEWQRRSALGRQAYLQVTRQVCFPAEQPVG